jgi:hypothetical protein
MNDNDKDIIPKLKKLLIQHKIGYSAGNSYIFEHNNEKYKIKENELYEHNTYYKNYDSAWNKQNNYCVEDIIKNITMTYYGIIYSDNTVETWREFWTKVCMELNIKPYQIEFNIDGLYSETYTLVYYKKKHSTPIIIKKNMIWWEKQKFVNKNSNNENMYDCNNNILEEYIVLNQMIDLEVKKNE